MSNTLASGHVWVRLVVASLIAVTTAVGVYMFAGFLWSDGGSLLDVLLLSIFAALYLWLAIAFWLATLGLILCLFSKKPISAPFRADAIDAHEYENLPATAVVMPIYNEEPASAFSGLLATCESVQKTSHGQGIDFFVLSDTTDSDIWVAEELAWATARRAVTKLDSSTVKPGGFYYRRRQNNVGLKSGNIRDFCERWGGGYKYMIILDADSVMDGWTIVEMIRRMEKDERIGILQVPPVPVSRQTLFARIQQFVAGIYGTAYIRGFAFWSQGSGNYWGHNAIIRMKPFIDHCGLPRLPGRGPLGGEITSHDFVEAAFMLRAGWEVRLAGDLGGSYEEPPTTIVDFVTRSRRWCQGNLQHLRLVALHGFHTASRFYFGMGAMAYLSSLLWLLFIVLTLITGINAPHGEAMGLLWMTLALLFLPKVWGYLVLLRDREAMRVHGGAGKAALSVFLEAVISALTAPIFMLFNVRFVIAILSGRGVRWDPQHRSDGAVTVSDAARTYTMHTAVGVIALVLLILVGSPGHWWLLAIIAGLVVSIPLAMSLGSVRVGMKMRDLGLFLGPEEIEPPSVLARQQVLRGEMQQVLRFSSRADIFRRVVLDAGLNDIHVALLAAQEISPGPWEKIESIAQVALHGGPEHLTRRDRLTLLSDGNAIAWLHRQAWKHWPVGVH